MIVAGYFGCILSRNTSSSNSFHSISYCKTQVDTGVVEEVGDAMNTALGVMTTVLAVVVDIAETGMMMTIIVVVVVDIVTTVAAVHAVVAAALDIAGAAVGELFVELRVLSCLFISLHGCQ